MDIQQLMADYNILPSELQKIIDIYKKKYALYQTLKHIEHRLHETDETFWQTIKQVEEEPPF